MTGPPLSPPEPSRYCPVCLANVDDAPREVVGNWELVHCDGCGAEVNVEQLLSRAEMLADARADAADDAYSEREAKEYGR